MMFSLIISTRGRVTQLRELFQYLAGQTCQDFEIIVSDQNEDDRLLPLLQSLAPEWPDRLHHLKSTGGSSRGRNAGLERAVGELVAFPDDDCRYPPRLLEEVARFFQTHPAYGFLTGRSVDDHGADAVSRHAREASPVGREKIYAQGIEFAFFIRRARLDPLRFDETAGPGAPTPWQADEGPDLMLRLMAKGVSGYYDPQYAVWHLPPVQDYGSKARVRAFGYACGSGHFLKKHQFPHRVLLTLQLRAVGGALWAALNLKPGKARFYLARWRGLREGWKAGTS